MFDGEGHAGPGALCEKGTVTCRPVLAPSCAQAHSRAGAFQPLTPLSTPPQILDIVSDIDNELSVTVMSSDLLPPECKAKLEAKRCLLLGASRPTCQTTYPFICV